VWDDRRIPVLQTPAAADRGEAAGATPMWAVGAAEMRAVIPTPVGAAEMPEATRTLAAAAEMPGAIRMLAADAEMRAAIRTLAADAEMAAAIRTLAADAEMAAAIRTLAVAVEMRVVMAAEATEAAATPGAADLRTAISRVDGGEGTPARIRQTAVAGAEIQGTSTALETTVR
jgi:hypothetical protein